MTITDTFTPEQLQDDDVDAGSQGSSRKRLVIFGGAAAIIGLGAGLYFMFGMGGGSTDDSQFRLNTPVATAKPSANATPNAVTPSAPAASSPAKVGSRDPFKPLKAGVVEAPAAVADVPGTATGTSSGAGAAPNAAPPAAAPVATPSAAPASTVTLAVSAVDPVGQTVVVDVDGKKYATGVGKSFAQGFSVYSVFNAKCVGILYGSKSTPVCMSAPVTVTP